MYTLPLPHLAPGSNTWKGWKGETKLSYPRDNVPCRIFIRRIKYKMAGCLRYKGDNTFISPAPSKRQCSRRFYDLLLRASIPPLYMLGYLMCGFHLYKNPSPQNLFAQVLVCCTLCNVQTKLINLGFYWFFQEYQHFTQSPKNNEALNESLGQVFVFILSF